MSSLPALLARAQRLYGTQQALAEAIGLSSSRLGRLKKGQWALDVRGCLRLAVAAALPPSDVLRAAGKADIADLIEELYGRGASNLSDADRATLEWWHGLKPDVRTVVRGLTERPRRSERAVRRVG